MLRLKLLTVDVVYLAYSLEHLVLHLLVVDNRHKVNDNVFVLVQESDIQHLNDFVQGSLVVIDPIEFLWWVTLSTSVSSEFWLLQGQNKLQDYHLPRQTI